MKKMARRDNVRYCKRRIRFNPNKLYYCFGNAICFIQQNRKNLDLRIEYTIAEWNVFCQNTIVSFGFGL